MATTRTGPSINWQSAGSDIFNLMLDTARSKLIDVEQIGDERNVPDMMDLRSGQYPTQTATGTAAPQVGGITMAGMPPWAMWVGIAAVAAGVVYAIAD